MIQDPKGREEEGGTTGKGGHFIQKLPAKGTGYVKKSPFHREGKPTWGREKQNKNPEGDGLLGRIELPVVKGKRTESKTAPTGLKAGREERMERDRFRRELGRWVTPPGGGG